MHDNTRGKLLDCGDGAIGFEGDDAKYHPSGWRQFYFKALTLTVCGNISGSTSLRGICSIDGLGIRVIGDPSTGSSDLEASIHSSRDDIKPTSEGIAHLGFWNPEDRMSSASPWWLEIVIPQLPICQLATEIHAHRLRQLTIGIVFDKNLYIDDPYAPSMHYTRWFLRPNSNGYVGLTEVATGTVRHFIWSSPEWEAPPAQARADGS